MLLYFKVSHKVKYSIEAFHLLAHYHYIYSEKLCRQLLCSCTINVHGKPVGRTFPWIYAFSTSTEILKQSLVIWALTLSVHPYKGQAKH